MLAYCLLSWMSGGLPWAAVSSNANAVMDAKLSYREAVPTLIRDALLRAPAAAAAAATCGLKEFLEHAFQLPYDAAPDYALLRRSLDHPTTVTTTATTTATTATTSPCKERKSRGQVAKRK
ncbi:serine/threonine-protein kinase VRK2-like [Lampetra fluviatilis]